jgi:hypothetical protein
MIRNVREIRMSTLKHTIMAVTLFLATTEAAFAADPIRGGTIAATRDGRVRCSIEVLRSEELPGAAIYQNRVRTTLLVNAPGRVPFETTVVRLIPWQVPPPRQGQRLTMLCDPESLSFPIFF